MADEVESDVDTDPRHELEVWEITIPGSVWVYRYDKRDRAYRHVKVAGTGPTRVRLTRDDREFTQEQMLDENRHLDPFTNGTLVQVVKGKRTDDGLSAEGFKGYLDLHDPDEFRAAVDKIDDELTVRRLRDVVEEQGLARQVEVIREVIDAKWKAGGTQRTVREMIAAGERIGGEVLT